MSPAECNYEIYDKKLLAIINAFELWRSELEKTEEPVQVVTDHKNLEYFMSNKLLNRRQARWSEFLSKFNFEIIYRPGSMNNRADVFTRRSGDVPKKRDNRRQFQWQTMLKKKNFKIQQLILAINDDEPSPITGSSFPTPSDSETNDELSVTINDAIGTAYAEDERTQFFFNALNTGQRTLKKFLLSETSVTDGRIFFRDKLFVPDVGQLRLRLIKKFHDDPAAGHPGKAKTYEIFSRYYYWPGIIDDVKRFVKNCYGCRRSKNFRDKYHGTLKLFPVPDRRWSHISIDFIVGLPVSRDLWGRDCINIMVVIDRLSKMVKCIFMDGIIAKDVAKAFYIHVWKNHGLPNFIISDRGRMFVNYFWDQLITRLGIKANLSTAYHPEIDGQTEILNSILEQYFKAYVNFLQNDWFFWLFSAEFVINNHVSKTTQCTPFLINSKQHLKMGLKPDPFVNKPMDLQKKKNKVLTNEFVEKMTTINEVFREQMAFVQASYENFANRHRQNASNYIVNDEVWFDTRNMQTKRPSKKLSDKFDGPFLITKIVSPHAYKLELRRDWTIHPVFHTNFFRPGSTDPLPGQLAPPPVPIIDEDGQDTWEVTRIFNSRIFRHRLQFLVNWVKDRPDWQPFENVIGAPDALNQYFNKYFTRPGHDVWQRYKEQHPDEL